MNENPTITSEQSAEFVAGPGVYSGAGAQARLLGRQERSDGSTVPKYDLFDWHGVWMAFCGLRSYFRLLGATFLVVVLLVVLGSIVMGPTYTAVALIGPPSPSPTGSTMASASAASVGNALASRMLGGAAGPASNDPYQEYLQLLPSTRLSQQLIAHDRILQTIFYRKWDAEKGAWKQPGPLRKVSNAIKRLMGQPIVNEPGVDDLTRYFKSHLSVTRSTVNTSFSLVPTLSSYLQVTFDYDDPAQAEALLSAVLLETDNIIRDEQLRDVTARIRYIRQQLAEQSLAVDERTALISILNSQEQLQMVMRADQRYASTLVVPPHASLKPTAPPSLGILIVISFLVSTALWMFLVFASIKSSWLSRIVGRFRKPTR